jgi:hypothetical protein
MHSRSILWQPCVNMFGHSPYASAPTSSGPTPMAYLPPSFCVTAGEGALRLVDGPTPAKGRLQWFHLGEWWNTCSLSIKGTTADVACRLMGFNTSSSVRLNSSTFDPAGNVSASPAQTSGHAWQKALPPPAHPQQKPHALALLYINRMHSLPRRRPLSPAPAPLGPALAQPPGGRSFHTRCLLELG